MSLMVKVPAGHPVVPLFVVQVSIWSSLRITLEPELPYNLNELLGQVTSTLRVFVAIVASVELNPLIDRRVELPPRKTLLELL